MPSKVCIVKCPDYSPENVDQAIAKIFQLLNLGSLISPGQKVLLKPNLLTDTPPDKGITTHPAIIKAVAEEVKGLGASPFLGDSPGGAGVQYSKAIDQTGMKHAGIPIVNFEESSTKGFISKIALDADVIINMPKLKTHELTQMTCGIKNMFGCVPGLQKVKYHFDAPRPEEFSEVLVNIFEKVRPAITIVDAVVVMEGQGPANGKLRRLNLLVASTDTVAVDAVCSRMIGYEPMEIDTTRIAYQRGLGEADISKIEILGDKLEIFEDFQHPKYIASLLNRIPKHLNKFIKPLINIIRKRPKINKKKCVKCMICVNSCPSHAIDNKSFKINKNKCIMCFCCRELCKYGAVDLKESILWKLLVFLKKHLMS